MKYFNIALFFVGIALTSCQSLVTEVQPKALNIPDSKLVLTCFISPQDTIIYAALSESSPLFGEKNISNDNYVVLEGDTLWFYNDNIKNANIKLSDGKQTATFGYDTLLSIYYLKTAQMPFKISPEKSYFISASDGKRNVEATCTVPANHQNIENYQISVDTSLVNFQSGVRRRNIKAKVNWQDGGKKNTYYRLMGIVHAEVTNFNSYIINHQIKDSIVTDTLYQAFRWDSRLLNNKNLENTRFDESGQAPLSYSHAISITGKKGVAIKKPQIFSMELALWVVDENYYIYHRTVRENSQSDGNPFVEPTPTFTNIKNGLGCFGASNKTSIKIPKEQLPKF